MTEVKYNGSTRFVYTYTGDGQLYEARDVLLGLTHTYTYDSLGRLIYSSTSDDSGTLLYTSAAYDDANRLSAYSYSGAGLPVRNQSYTYSTETGLLSTATLGTGETATYVYDGLERVSGVNVTNSSNAAVYAVTYGYADPSGTTEGNTTELISDLTYTRGGTTLLDLNYTYDSMGRISSDGTYTYTYDALGQLKTVKNSSGATVASYTYDGAGNILTATENGETVNYTYGNSNWRDLLTAYDGSAITYDEIGNPTSYRGWTFGWDNGRQLTSASNGDNTLSYTYDVNGIRKSKTVNGVEHSYIYNGSQLLLESFGTTRLEFLYDVNGLPYALRHSTNSGSSYTTYYYILNQQGDVVALMNGSGSIVVRYTYDAWGKVTSVTNHSGAAITDAANVANINPIRYRGYYYDTDTNLYYCLSRYYDPEVGRWINADNYISTGQGIVGCNMFAYCMNNPVNASDSTGQFALTLTAAYLLLGGILAFGSVLFFGNGLSSIAANPPAFPTFAPPKFESKAETEEKSQTIDIAPALPDTPSEPTVIYRYGGTNPANLTPRKQDVELFPITGTGLSFSTRPPKPGQTAAVTTIEALNATGVVYAVEDGKNHVSVFPLGGTIEDWYNAGPSSPWTTAVKSVVVKWDGTY